MVVLPLNQQKGGVIEEVKSLLATPFAILTLVTLLILAVLRGKRVVHVSVRMLGFSFSLTNEPASREGTAPVIKELNE